MSMKQTIIIVLALAIGAIFIYGVFMAYVYSVADTPAHLSPVLSYIVTSVAALLTTNLGAVLGITALSQAAFAPNARSDFRMSSEWKENWTVPIVAAGIYLIILGLVTAYWLLAEGLTEEASKIVDIIPNFGKTFIGVAIASLSFLLRVDAKKS